MTQLTMLDTIKSIPDLMERRLACMDEITEVVSALGDERKIKVIASGTSYNAAFTVKSFSEEILGIPLEIMYPNYFNNHFNEKKFDTRDLYIFISQGGSTKSVLEGIHRIHALGGTTLSITENKDSPVGNHSKHHLEIGSDQEPFIYRTAGYSLTAMTLYLFLIKWAVKLHLLLPEQQEQMMIEMNGLAGIVKDITKDSEIQYDVHREALKNCKTIFFAGGGSLWAAAQEANIKFMEMVPIVTNSFEIEEIIHGPQNCFHKQMGFFFLVNNKNDYEKARRIDEFIRQEIGAFSKIVTNLDGDNTMNIPSSGYFDPLAYTAVFQVLSYKLSQDHGRELSKKIYPQIDQYIKKSL